jgi:hypothetical protein
VFREGGCIAGKRMQVGGIAGAGNGTHRTGLHRPQDQDMCRGMAAMIAGDMIPFIIRHMTRVSGNYLVFSNFINMASKRPHRAIANRADDEPQQEKTPEHDAMHT